MFPVELAYWLVPVAVTLVAVFFGARRVTREETVKTLRELCEAQGAMLDHLRQQNQDQEARIERLEAVIAYFKLDASLVPKAAVPDPVGR